MWILHHLLIPRVRWPLQIYEVPISTVTKMDQKMSVYVRSWLKLHHTLTNLALFSKVSPCPLPLKSLVSVFKSAKVSGHLLLRDSDDKFISSDPPSLKSGAWSVSDAVKEAESCLLQNKIIGYHQSGRAGFGSIKSAPSPPKNTYAFRKLISETVVKCDESKDLARAVQLHLQGYWTSWCSFVKNNLSWKSMLLVPEPLLKFMISATFGTLPSPSNLKRWKIPNVEPSCFLCKKPTCTIAHILSGCKVSLKQGRYDFRHNSILVGIISFIKPLLSSKAVPKPSIGTLKSSFIPAGKSKLPFQKSSACPNGVLDLASDWRLLSDLDSNLVFPPFITTTTLRPDIVIFSKCIRTVVIIELTSPCEENMSERHSDKVLKYTSLCTAASHNDWSVHFFAVEVGARGYCAESMRFAFLGLGMSRKHTKLALKELSSISVRCSFIIWMSKDSYSWEECDFTMAPNETFIPPKTSSSSTTLSSPSSKLVSPASSIHPSNLSSNESLDIQLPQGLINKGNTCYVNSILQALSALPKLWSSLTSELSTLSPISRSLLKTLSCLRTSKSSLDPSPFLSTLENNIIKSGDKDFKINKQQDAPEILSVILTDMCVDSVFTSSLLEVRAEHTIVCDICDGISSHEDISSIFQLPACKSIDSSIKQFLTIE